MFTHLHVHTQYSILDGLSSIKKLFERCKELGMPALAITDHGNMFGVKDFFNTSKNFPEVKPIIGCEVYVTDWYDHKLKDRDHRRYYHLILLAKNLTGYYNLVKIVSLAHLEGMYYGKPRITHEVIEQYHEGLICCSACLAGELPRRIAEGDMDGALKAVEWHRRVFGDDYYMEVQLHKTEIARTDIPEGCFDKIWDVYTRQSIVNKGIFELAEQTGVKVVATNDVHFVNKEDGPVHDRLICLTTNAFVDDPDRLRYTQQEYLKSEEEMAVLFPEHPEVISNTQEIVDKVEAYSIDRGHVLPKFDLEPEFLAHIDEYLEMYKGVIDEGRYTIKKDKEGNEISRDYRGDDFCNSVAYLCYKTYEGAAEPQRYGSELTDQQKERLDFELKTICRMGFPDYFLIVMDYIAASRKEGYLVGPGRGSAAGSAVAYCLGITNLDPIKYDLLFERFLNPDRISMPDIDVDFESLPAAHKYVEDKYSTDHVSRVITFGTMAAKSAIKDVARISHLSIDESNRLSKMVPDRLSDKKEKEYIFNPKLDELKPGFKIVEKDGKTYQVGLEDTDIKITLKDCYRLVPEFKEELAKEGNELNKEVLYYAQRLEGSIRQVGVHACATIIGRGNLTDYIPLSVVEDKDSKEMVPISQYDGHYIEEVGMLKMDFLGLNTLSIIKECLNNIKASKGIDIDIEAIPIDDQKTYALYTRGDTDSVFQFESPGMKKWLQKLHPDRFEDLIAMNALYRPGPMDYIPDFVDRKLGKAEIKYDIPVMEQSLAETYGVTVYQEQVMMLSRILSNFTRGEADKLRKAMGKKQIDVLNSLKGKFMEEGVKNGHDEKILDKIWKDWEKFASYAFNKSHATCYAWVSYQTGYLKAHYPSEFFAANLTCNLTKMDEIKKIIADCKAHKINVLVPDVNESESKFTVNAGGDIRFGLGGIKGFGDNVVNAILNERRENGLFKDIYDFVERMHSFMGRRNFESLLYSGAFGCFGYPRPQYARPMKDNPEKTFTDAIVRYGEMFGNDDFDAGASLFGDAEEMKPTRPEMPSWDGEYDQLELLHKEKELVGMYLSNHPLDPFKLEISYFVNCTCSSLPIRVAKAQEKRVPEKIAIAGFVTNVETKTALNGNPYADVTIEDFDGTYIHRVNGKKYEEQMQFFQVNKALLIEGEINEPFFRKPEERKEKGDLDYKFKVTGLSMLGNVISDKVKEMKLIFSTSANISSKDLLAVLKKEKGTIPISVVLHDHISGHSVEFVSRKISVRPSITLTSQLDEMGVQWKLLK